MNLHALFWTLALANMIAAFVIAAIGLYYIRSRQIDKHRKMMRLSAVLVGSFVLCYAVKVALLGREDLSSWSDSSLAILRIHEGLVLCFVSAGAYALFLSRRLGVPATQGTEIEALRIRHRRAGRAALVSFALALLTAALTYRAILKAVPAGPLQAAPADSIPLSGVSGPQGR